MEKNRLIEALSEAATQHQEFQEGFLKGQFDDEWHSFYAAFIIGKLGTFTTPSKLTELIKKADANIKAKLWQENFAEFILDNI